MNRAQDRQRTGGLSSMTGFGAASGDNGRYRVTVELRTVNHRGLDLVLRMKDACRIQEPELRAMYPQFKFTYVEQGTGKEIQQVAVKAPASNLWKYLLGAILGLLVLETWLAQMFGAKR